MFIGLTGGIASGKNFIASLFKEKGFYVLDADEVTRLLMSKGRAAYNEIINSFGAEILSENNEIDRGRLREKIVNDTNMRRLLENIIHPKVDEYSKKWYGAVRGKDDKAVCIYHAPLIIEGGYAGKFDAVILIYAGRDTQIDRLKKRGFPPLEDGIKFIDAQMSYEDKLAYADYVIDNDSDADNAKKEVERVFNLIKIFEYTKRKK